MGRPVAVVLAAGTGSRFDGAEHKLLTALPPSPTRPAEPVLARSLASVAVLDADHVAGIVVVSGAADIAAIVELTAQEFGLDGRLHLAPNPDFESGQASSVRRGLDRVGELGGEIAVIGLGDQPDVSTGAWIAVADAATAPDARPICVASYDGRLRNPVALHRSVWDRVPADGDRGARDLIRLHPDLVTPVPSLGSPADIDTVEDLRRWQST